MALPAGRVGVTPDSVDANGKVITPDPLPEHTAADAGKQLTIGLDGKPMWAEDESELPEHTAADAGKQLTIGLDGEPMWAEDESELPEYTVGDAGKQLSVNGDGDGLEWKTPEGGVTNIVTNLEVALPFKIDGKQLYAYKKTYTGISDVWVSRDFPSQISAGLNVYAILGRLITPGSTIYPLTYIRDPGSGFKTGSFSWHSTFKSFDYKGPYSSLNLEAIFIYTKE